MVLFKFRNMAKLLAKWLKLLANFILMTNFKTKVKCQKLTKCNLAIFMTQPLLKILKICSPLTKMMKKDCCSYSKIVIADKNFLKKGNRQSLGNGENPKIITIETFSVVKVKWVNSIILFEAECKGRLTAGQKANNICRVLIVKCLKLEKSLTNSMVQDLACRENPNYMREELLAAKRSSKTTQF